MADELPRALIDRQRSVHRPVALLLCFLLAACKPEPQVHTAEFLAMGTTVSISVVDPAANDRTELLANIGQEMQRQGREWYPWAPDGSGELARLNAALAAGQTTEVSGDLAALLEDAQSLAAATGGRFDPAIGALVELWGFTSGARDLAEPLPTPDALSNWARQRPTYIDLILEGTTVSSSHPGLKLDLGAIAKGHVVDRAVNTLRNRGVANALVAAGGNVGAIGSAPRRPWRVAIRDARGPGILGWVELQDGESIDTSGDYERFAIVQGKRIHHVFDPRSGAPVDHTAAVTVIANTGTLADAAATALLVAGPEHWQEIAQILGVKAILRTDAEGNVQATAEMARRLQAQSGRESMNRIKVVGDL